MPAIPRLTMILLVLVLAGCGQKGALFLPPDESPEPQQETSSQSNRVAGPADAVS